MTDLSRILVISAHPRGGRSFIGALAAAYAAGARRAGMAVEELDLAALSFDPHVREPSPRMQALEPDLELARAAIARASHLVFVYPTWWGTFPALLKGFLDRVLLPGWAFEETTSGTGYEGLLSGKTAELITTMDTPGLVYRFVYGAPGTRAMARATLGFCGIDVNRVTRFGVAKAADAERRAQWLAQVEALGGSLAEGVLTPGQRFWRRVKAWLAALRLHFYPMTLISYAVGALAATQGGALHHGLFWLGFLVLFLLEAATVFSNDLHDYDSDRHNRFWGPFSGGSRALISGSISRTGLAQGAWATGGASALALLGVLWLSPNAMAAALVMVVTAGLALAYTLPPVKLSHRGLGEIDVAVTHSIAVLLFGYVAQGGGLFDAAPWLLALPLGLSVFPAILLSGVPDHAADRAAGKETLVVKLGIGRSWGLAALFVVLAVLAALVLWLGAGLAALRGLGLFAGVHAYFLIRQIWREAQKPAAARRIDGLMVLALSFILWFGLVPLLNLSWLSSP